MKEKDVENVPEINAEALAEISDNPKLHAIRDEGSTFNPMLAG